MADFVHPVHPERHEPKITAGDIGARAQCSCGWSATCPTRARAAIAVRDHGVAVRANTTTQREGTPS